ncbi:low specificity L-threonine aldolase [Primorskyibacter aestuariivivens]|uniref:threonine aldolase family protein n=1 Tax=Primorskyibacter aestuariivivens TaxID=1888912 RepID=UPI0023013A0E|nr:low specificity L-threonine aldolase [Primorskyibacter aestuariivivens]MDA7427292.1 low specificity L-threonine aldolase [Primorskyibacter aestuariivivens]
MEFMSDNAGPVHPKVMQALMDANTGYAAPYGNDPLTDQATARLRDLFEAPEAEVFLVTLGTAANVLALAGFTHPWDTVFCTPMAHIVVDECNAPEFYMGGAKLTHVGEGPKMTPEALEAAIAMYDTGDHHMAQAGPVSITQVTERGTLYSLDEIATLSKVARAHGCPVHLDGARFANAAVALGCSPAEMSWKAGVDVVSFGGTKNGLMGVEAIVVFDPAKAREFVLRRKRGAHLMSKYRYLSAQMVAYLTDDLWQDLARASNANAAHLAKGLRSSGVAEFLFEPQANMLFVTLPREAHRRARAAGARYELHGSVDGPDGDCLSCRLVCDWSLPREMIDRFVELITP